MSQISIDFKKIVAGLKGQTESFERLSVHLFRKSANREGAEFFPLRGDGGDGGVEAYFLLPCGGIIGVQAKYFSDLNTSHFNQIKKSFEAAQKMYPSLVEYWIYLPFDLTGKTGRGKGEQGKFKDWKNEIEAVSKENGSSVSIKLISQSSINDQILRVDTNGGLRRYYFDNSILIDKKIHNCLESSIATSWFEIH